MSIDDQKIVDIISTNPETEEVVLTISDHLQWHDNHHLLLLQEKINSYLAFLESGEIFESHPDAIGKRIRIDVVCKYFPSIDGETFFARSSSIISNAGFALSWRVFSA